MGKINCFSCVKKCKGDVLKVGDKYFHIECFTCSVCFNKLNDTGFFVKDNCFYCPDDYKKYHAAVCLSCQEKIVDEVVTALNHTFHKECFRCSNCRKNFLPGDQVSMKKTDFLCDFCSNQFVNSNMTENTESNIIMKNVTLNESVRLNKNGKNLNFITENSDSFSVPIRRKIETNKPFMSVQPSINNLNRPRSSTNTRLQRSSGEEANFEIGNKFGNSFTMNRHFHLPPDVKKVQNKTVEESWVGVGSNTRKAQSMSRTMDNNTKSLRPKTVAISETFKGSTVDSSSDDTIQKKDLDNIKIPTDPISASRSPSAVCEPLTPLRYEIHKETSLSRNEEFFNQPERHLGYSLDFVNSSTRSFSSENAVPNYRNGFRNSYVELRNINNKTNINGLRSLERNSNRTRYSSSLTRSKCRNSTEDSNSFLITAIPYGQLKLSNRRIIKNLDRSRLETYINDEEFQQLFNLTRQAFYQLPEWKRNDLKKQVDLF